MFNSMLSPTELESFFNAYLECAAWSSFSNVEEGSNESMEEYEFSIDCHNRMLNDCKNFTNEYSALLRRAYRTHCYTFAEAGHDFWLTRNRHGAGFWDRGLGKIGQWLTDAAHCEGSVDLYLNDQLEIES